MFASKPQLAGALLKRAHSRGIRAAVARWRIEEDHQLAKQVAGLDAGQVIRWKSWHRWTSICLLAYIYLAIAAALQRQHDTGAELAELIPITAGTATASAWHGHPATPARPGPPAALVDLATPPPAPGPPSPPAMERLCRDCSMITTNYSRRIYG